MQYSSYFKLYSHTNSPCSTGIARVDTLLLVDTLSQDDNYGRFKFWVVSIYLYLFSTNWECQLKVLFMIKYCVTSIQTLMR